MELNGLSVFFGGCLGFILLEVFKFGRTHIGGGPVRAKYKKSSYWFGFVSLAIVSGIVTILNGTDKVPLERAVQLGLAAPAILSGLATSYKNEKEKKLATMNFTPDSPTELGHFSAADKVFISLAW
jgi:hypothetical protein